jgi:hypothetical protein
MNEITCSHGNGPECSKCRALDIPEVEELERELRARIADLEAERDKCNGLLQGYITTLAECVVKRDAARAGEARAVEAIKGLLNQLHEFDFEIDGSVEFFDSVQQCRDATDNTQPALDWLARQRAEAVAAWIEKQVAENLERYGTHYYERTTDDLMREAAAFRAAALRAGEVDND